MSEMDVVGCRERNIRIGPRSKSKDVLEMDVVGRRERNIRIGPRSKSKESK